MASFVVADRRSLLTRRWRGIRTALFRWCLVALPLLATGPLLGMEAPVALGGSVLLLGVGDAVIRSVRTLRLRSTLEGPLHTVTVTRHRRTRHKLPTLEVAGLWPAGVASEGEPPLSVRVEDVGSPLQEGGTVDVLGDLRPGGRVVLVADGRVVWTLRPVKEGLHPRRLRRYDLEDDIDDDAEER